MPRVSLTPRKEQVYQFILAYKSQHDGNSPSIVEIGEGCNISSKSYVSTLLQGLETLGMIRCNYGGGKTRMLEVVGAKWTPPKLKLTKSDARKLLRAVVSQ